MFTGIVEAMGTILTVTQTPYTLTIHTPHPSPILVDAHPGDSISVNGVCLTIVTFSPHPTSTFTVGLAPETLRRTNLSDLVPGSQVNLERAVSAGETRMGGHMVQGHVDGVATIVAKVRDGESVRFRFQFPEEKEGGNEATPTMGRGLMRYIVEKGFVCVDGASLTVTETDENEGSFGVMLVAYTQEKIVTARKEIGGTVNVEVDQVGKYIEKQIQAHLSGHATTALIEGIVEKVVQRKLVEAGVLPPK